MSKDETKIDQEAVRNEHLADINVPAHWVYALGVIIAGFFVMVGLIALLGAG